MRDLVLVDHPRASIENTAAAESVGASEQVDIDSMPDGRAIDGWDATRCMNEFGTEDCLQQPGAGLRIVPSVAGCLRVDPGCNPVYLITSMAPASISDPTIASKSASPSRAPL